MAAKNTPSSKSRDDIKNIKNKDPTETPTYVMLSRAAKKSPLFEDHDSLYYEKGLELSDEHLNEVKNETDVLKKADDALGNKSSTPVVKTLKTTRNVVSVAADTTVKKEVSNEEESLSEVLAYTPTSIKSANDMDVEAVEPNSNNTTLESQGSSETKKEPNNVICLASKNISDEERRKLRAKRFNIIVAESSRNAEKDMPRNVSTPASTKNTSSSVNYPTPTYDTLKKRAERFGENVSTVMKSTPTYDTLKKRAERFGENVSTVMKSLDYKEKMLKRKLKFLESVTSLKELEIKKRRAERFRMV